MKILHTSDWHIGRSLYGRKRYDEFLNFFEWLAEIIEKESVKTLLVSGDIFDTSTPSNRAQALYYRFLTKVAASGCHHIVIIAGNHDSPSFLNAPKELLKALNVHVVSSITQNLEDEVITLKGPSDKPEAIVCAIPYLRDRDIRMVKAGESIDDKTTKLIEGIKKHYTDIGKIAKETQKKYGGIPIIGMGHLFAAGGKTVDGDGVRELYVGSLAHVGKDVFPHCLDYVALGHLHVPQEVGHKGHIRYSGSPIPMGYGESNQEKKVVIITFDGRSPKIKEHPIPCFQKLERICGTMPDIIQKIVEEKSNDSQAWLEVEYTGTKIAGNLRQRIEEAIKGTNMEVLRIKNKQLVDRIINRISTDDILDNLDVNDVFNRLLDTVEVEDNQRPLLIQAYEEIIKTLHEEDKNAE
ncbi:MAG: exonuclease subunit SbcD [Desulfobacteraceae bacterium]|nr:exonuclease subunit SbcD [Desulfobacteraceae bacterium]